MGKANEECLQLDVERSRNLGFHGGKSISDAGRCVHRDMVIPKAT